MKVNLNPQRSLRRTSHWIFHIMYVDHTTNEKFLNLKELLVRSLLVTGEAAPPHKIRG